MVLNKTSLLCPVKYSFTQYGKPNKLIPLIAMVKTPTHLYRRKKNAFCVSFR